MTISLECPQAAFQAPPGYSDENLGQVAAIFGIRRAVTGQEDRLAAAFGAEQVAEAQRQLGQLSEFVTVSQFSERAAQQLAEMKALAASDPFKHDYPDVRAQRRKALDESIADAEALLGVTMPEIDVTAASIATTSLFWEAAQGSPVAADILPSRHVTNLWEMATGEPEVPQLIALDLVAQAAQ